MIIAIVLLSIAGLFVYQYKKPFGLGSRLAVTHHLHFSFNGAPYEILLIAWKKGRERSEEYLHREIARSKCRIGREDDQLVMLSSPSSLPLGLYVSTENCNGEVEITLIGRGPRYHATWRQGHFSLSDSDLYAIVPKALAANSQSRAAGLGARATTG